MTTTTPTAAATQRRDEAILRCYLGGVNSRRIRTALKPLLGERHLSKSAVSRIVGRLKALFATWQGRDLSTEPYPIVFLDGFHLKVRVARRVVSVPVLAATRDGDRDALATEPQQYLPRAPELVEFLQHEANRLLDPHIGIELDCTGWPVHEAHGQVHPQLPALGLRALRLEGALPQRRHREVAHDPLQAQEQPIVDEARVIDALVIDPHDPGNRSELHQL
jgi:hypothetical protein